MERLFLHEATEAVKDAAYRRLEAHRLPGGMLEGLMLVVRGDRYVAAPVFPLCGVSGGIATPGEQSTYAVRWTYPVRLLVQVEDHEPDWGYAECERLAALCFHAMFTDPETGDVSQQLVAGPEVYGISAGQFEPPQMAANSESLFQARASVSSQIRTTF